MSRAETIVVIVDVNYLKEGNTNESQILKHFKLMPASLALGHNKISSA